MLAGIYKITYGAPTRIEIRGNDTDGYTIVAKARVTVTGASCTLPTGTVLGRVDAVGDGTYRGEHGLWYVNSCERAPQTASVDLLPDALEVGSYTMKLGNGEQHFMSRIEDPAK